MYGSLRVAAVIPARNEERLIGRTIWPVPDIIDTIYVIDDGSQDRTGEVVQHYAASDTRIRLISHKINRGVGAAIITGYRQAHKDGHDVFVVVGGDAQMDWLDLDNLLQPIAEGTADYTKGNRFIYGSKNTPGNAWREMPTRRLLGNVCCSILTKIASGYYHVNDSQMGYTALHKRAFKRMNWKLARKGYGYPAEWLMRFHSEGVRVTDVPVRAIYLKNERQTQIRVRKFLFYMMGIIVKGGLERVNREYLPEKVSLPTISLPMIGVQIGNFFRHLYLRIGSMRVLSRLSGVSGIRQQLGGALSLPKIRSLRIGLEDNLNPSQKKPSLDMYGGQVENKPIDHDTGAVANRVLKKAKRIVFDSTLQGEQSSNSIEELLVRIEEFGKKIRFHITKEDLNQSAK